MIVIVVLYLWCKSAEKKLTCPHYSMPRFFCFWFCVLHLTKSLTNPHCRIFHGFLCCHWVGCMLSKSPGVLPSNLHPWLPVKNILNQNLWNKQIHTWESVHGNKFMCTEKSMKALSHCVVISLSGHTTRTGLLLSSGWSRHHLTIVPIAWTKIVVKTSALSITNSTYLFCQAPFHLQV